MLKLIEKDRHGEPIDSSLISSAINCYVELCVNTKTLCVHSKRVDLFVYKNSFEDIFIKETAEFYTRESSNFLPHNSFTAYVMEVERRLNEEEKRVKTYLHKSTEQRLLTTCEEILIVNHLKKFECEFKNLLDDQNIFDLLRMYRLLLRIPNGLDKPALVLGKYIRDEGISALANCADQTATVSINSIR